MTGYQWLYKGKQAQHSDITGRYDEFRKDGWSIFLDGSDLNGTVVENESVESIKVTLEPVTKIPEELFKCDSCDKVFKMKMHLGAHKRKHKRE